MSQLHDLGEDAVVQRITSLLQQNASVICGPGDDCAVIDTGDTTYQLLKTDAIIEGIHFLPNADPERIGWKAIARVISDIAAMGGTPGHMLVTIALPRNKELSWLESLYKGLNNCASTHKSCIVGGESSSLPEGSPTMISIAGTGTVGKDSWVSRSTGKPGDHIFVTGTLGGSITGKHLDFTPRLEEGKWLAEGKWASSMMDLSDGLGSDLPRLSLMSQCDYQVTPDDLPLTKGCNIKAAISDGEDYELLFTVPAEKSELLIAAWPFQTQLSAIGQLTSVGDGSPLAASGWDHF